MGKSQNTSGSGEKKSVTIVEEEEKNPEHENAASYAFAETLANQIG